MKGKVKFFNEMKGFGFIAGEDGKEYFVHQSGLKEGATLHENDAVTFDVEQGDRGPKAVQVAKATEETTEEAPAEEQAEESTEEKSEESTEETTEEAPAEEQAEESTEEKTEEAPAEEKSEEKTE